ncbi:unnamed protein product [Durusdinium trenchii]|uniref:RING-type E3 ubiquitin transferase n=1 Tax=Durusdinium trenchii TaxID=1381693 RepID=A0ABP0I9S4_9DINO
MTEVMEVRDFQRSLLREDCEAATGAAATTRPKLDATLLLEERQAHSAQKHALFALASLNNRTAPSVEVSWCQLLALSLKPEQEPVLAVGRHKDCHIQLSDLRVSVNHFDIMVQKPNASNTAEDGLHLECMLIDRSSNGTLVNGHVVGKGKWCHLHTGDAIEVLPSSRVGDEEMIAFLFRNSSERLSGVQSISVLEELVLCPICMQPIYKCVALMPCSHSFCMSCCSDWIRRDAESAQCPLCRRRITAVMKNHPMDSVVEAYLVARPDRRRPKEELLDMDSRDKLRLGQSGKLVRDFCSFAAPGSDQHEEPQQQTHSQVLPPGYPRRQERHERARRLPYSRGSQVCCLQ